MDARNAAEELAEERFGGSWTAGRARSTARYPGPIIVWHVVVESGSL